MKIRNTIKSLALVGAVAALLPVGSAMATGGAGPGFDGIATNTDGNPMGCPTLHTCVILMTGDGFLQQEVTLTAGTGPTFIQTVIVNTDAPGSTAIDQLAFADNTFIQMGAGNGIKGDQTLREVDANFATNGNLFEASTQLLIGWADDGAAGLSNLKVSQSFWDNNNTGKVQSDDAQTDMTLTSDDFVNSFTLGVNLDANGVATGKAMSMLQDIGMSDPSGTGTDFQRFIIEQRSGDLLIAAGTQSLTNVGAGTGGTATWAADDDVMVVWLGQTVALGELGVSLFGYESITVDDNDGVINPVTVDTFSRTSANVVNAPFGWDADMVTNFGAPPVMP